MLIRKKFVGKIKNILLLDLLEHEKCSEMCVWIVRFGQKLRKLGHF
jgi:hypothetical protein